MADPDPRHHADPMNPGLQDPEEAREPVEQDSAAVSSARDPSAHGGPAARSASSSSEAVSGRSDGAERRQRDEDSPGEALVREGRGEPMGEIPEPNEPA